MNKRNIGLLTGLVFTFGILALIEANVLSHTNGHFIYPVDDTFIHLELAKNLAYHGNWGINPNEFGSASSSLLYTLILAILSKLFSASVLLPLIVNIAAGVALLVVMNNWLAKQGLSKIAIIIINLLVVFFTPLPIMIMSGMEHTLQCLICFLFLFHGCTWLGNKDGKQKLPWSLLLFAALLTSVRYEGLFLAALMCVAMLFHKKYLDAVKLGAAALLPVVIFGLYSVSKGSYFLPNSVLIKSNEVPLFGGGITHFLNTIFVDKLTLSKPGITAMATQRLVLLLLTCFLLFSKPLRLKPSYTLLLILLAAGTLLHLALASTGKFYRYEAYLVFCSVVIISTVFFTYAGEYFHRKPDISWIAAMVLFFFLSLPVILRSTAAFSKASRACINIYQQQYQMGQFLKNYYPDTGLAANDIGAVAYFTNGPVLDLWGLGSIEVSKSRKGNYWNATFLDSLSRQKNVKVAVIYDSWFNHSLEAKWKKIATWRIFDNVVCGDDVVSFYAVDPAVAQELANNLKTFAARLPREVEVHYY